MSKELFAVDVDGLRKILARRGGPAFAVLELIQNSLDEASANVYVTLAHVRRQLWRLTVEDDNPDGWADLTHAWTLFSESRKAKDPTLRGRFNLGEKLVIAICQSARISTTTGTVYFSRRGRRQTRERHGTGSIFEGELQMTRAAADSVEELLRLVIVPENKAVFYNEEVLPARTPLRSFMVQLATEIADAEGYLRPTRRLTRVDIHRPIEDSPMLYEMGLPVVDTGDTFSVDIQQKVPLNTDRDNVTVAFLREVRTAVANNAYDLIEGDIATETWVGHALEDPDLHHPAVEQILTERYGKKRVIYDPSDPEANKLAVSKGYSLITGRELNKKQWDNVKRYGAALPAGQVTPSPKPYSEKGTPRIELARADWTPGMSSIAALTEALGERLMGVRISVHFVNDQRCRNFSGTYGRQGERATPFGKPAWGGYGYGTFEYNVVTLGRAWFNRAPDDEEVLALILHEFGHQVESDHLSSRYHDALCTLGARLARLLVAKPSFFDSYGVSQEAR